MSASSRIVIAVTFVASPFFGSISQAAIPATLVRKNLDHANNQRVVKELHSAKQLLEKADHDYAGHRARAVHEITTAIHELQHHGKSTSQHRKRSGSLQHPANRNVPATGKKLKEPQAVSDAQLKQAGQILANSLTQISSNHTRARANIQAAMNELNTALKIK